MLIQKRKRLDFQWRFRRATEVHPVRWELRGPLRDRNSHSDR